MDENNIIKKLYGMQNSNLSQKKKKLTYIRWQKKKKIGYTTTNNNEIFFLLGGIGYMNKTTA